MKRSTQTVLCSVPTKQREKCTQMKTEKHVLRQSNAIWQEHKRQENGRKSFKVIIVQEAQ